MNSGAEVGLIALAVAREMLLGYFRLLETAGMTEEQKEAHYQKIREEFMLVNRSTIPKPEDL